MLTAVMTTVILCLLDGLYINDNVICLLVTEPFLFLAARSIVITYT